MTAAPSRTRRIAEEHELGQWARVVRAPDPALSGVLTRDLVGFEQRSATFSSWLEPPGMSLTLMVDLEGAISLDGAPLPSAWIGGLADRYAVVGFSPPRYASLDIKLSPLGAYTVLARPLGELRNEIVGLEDAFGAAGRRLLEQLHGVADWDARFDAVEELLRARARSGPQPAPAVSWALARLWQSEGRARVESLAAALGCSRRYLRVRFQEQVGLPPKRVARLIRFGAVRRRIGRAPGRWADIAHESGYADQAHLNRDFRELAGTTPGDYVRRLLPGAGVVGDGVPFVQDRAPGRA